MKTIPLILLSLLVPSLARGAGSSPYAGQQTRSIKALSADEIAGYLAGRGMGLARPAELNGYPGPRHVLDAAADLNLTREQTNALTRVFEAMRTAALPLGEKLVAREADLDLLFVRRQISGSSLRKLTREIGRLQGELRAVHLQAHLATTRILSPDQVAAYNHLRGYDFSAVETPAEAGIHPDPS